MPAPLHLVHRLHTPAAPEHSRVASDVYDMVANGTVVGEIHLRLGDTEHLRRYGGHVGYRVEPQHRGHGYAARSLQLIAAYAETAGFEEIWITCTPDNTASRRTLENAGAQYVETVETPPNTDLYARGDRLMRRYRLTVSNGTEKGGGAARTVKNV